MIGRKNLHVTAERPNFPLGALCVRAGSAANVALFDVPVRAGVSVTGVTMRVTNCDGESADYAAVQTGTLWVVDVPAAHFATPGEVPNGVEVWASGTGADGEPHTWSIGVGDLCVLDGDSDTPVPSVAWTAIKLRADTPTSPVYGDAIISNGALYVYDGTQWIGGGGGGGGVVDDSVTRTSSNAVKSSGIWSAIWGALTALPTGFTSLYDWVVDQLTGKVSKTGDTITGTLVLKGSALQIEDADTAADMGGMYAVGSPSAGATVLKLIRWSGGASQSVVLTAENAATIDYVQAQLAGKVSGSLGSGGWVVTNGQRNYVFASDSLADDDITIARIAELRYAKHVLTTPAGSATLLDRADNLYVGDSSFTSCTFTLPAARDGRIRDFLLDVDNSANSSGFDAEFYGLGTAFAMAVNADDVSASKTAGEVLAEMTSVEANTRARFYFTETAQTVTVGSTSLPVISIQRLSIATATVRGGAA